MNPDNPNIITPERAKELKKLAKKELKRLKKQRMRKVIIPAGEGSVPDEVIKAAVKKVIKEREDGKSEPRKDVDIHIVADKPKKKSKKSLTELMKEQLDEMKPHYLGYYEQEFKFHPTRRWKFDFAWPNNCSGGDALEIEGGTWVGGRHINPMGFEKDCEKYNEAAILGWTVIRVTGAMVRDGRALDFLKRL